MLSRTESLRRRRVHSEDALESVRLKNSRSGYLSRVKTLCRTAEVLLNDSRNVNEVSKKLLACVAGGIWCVSAFVLVAKPGCIPHRPHAEVTPRALKMYAE